MNFIIQKITHLLRPLLAVVTVCLLLSGCGFHLKGSQSVSFKVNMSILSTAEADAFYRVFRRVAKQQGINEVPLTQAEWSVELLGERIERFATVKDETGRATEYLITMRVKANVTKTGEEPVLISEQVSDNFVYDNTRLLASNRDESERLTMMRQALSQQLLAQLASRDSM